MNINDMPDDGLMLVFKQIPLQELLDLLDVCTRWQVIIEQMCAGKRSLKIFDGIEEMADYCSDILSYNLQDNPKFQLKPIENDDAINLHKINKKKLELFQGVESLVVCDPINIAIPLENITSLTLMLRYYPSALPDLFKHINSFINLKHLVLFRLSGEVQEPTLPILNQLEEFALCSYYNNCIPLLAQLGSSIRKLTLKFVNNKFSDFEKLLKDNPNICNITHLSTQSVINDELEYEENILERKKFFHLICSNFKQLKCLEIQPEPTLKHDEAVFSLDQLKHLEELCLLGLWNMEVNLLSQKVKTIKTLHLKLQGNKFDDAFPKVNFQEIFPNLNILNIAHAPFDHFTYFLSDAKKYFADNPFQGEITINYYIKSHLDCLEHHRAEYEEHLDEQARLEASRYNYDDDYDDDYDYDYDYYDYDSDNRTHDTEESYFRKTWNS